MRRVLSYILFGLLGLGLVVFFVANRQPVKISMDPFNLENPAFFIGPFPMWTALVITLTVGFLLGAFGMWLSQSGLRQKSRARKAEIRRLKAELDRVAEAPAPAADGTTLPAVRT